MLKLFALLSAEYEQVTQQFLNYASIMVDFKYYQVTKENTEEKYNWEKSKHFFKGC